MAERLNISKASISYSGLFSMRELFDVILQWARDKGYFPLEKSHTEVVQPDGRFIEMNMEPFKKFSDYAKSVIKLRVQLSGVKDVTVSRDDKKVKLQEGKVSLSLDAILETDHEHTWESKPILYFLRTVVEKYVLRPFISSQESLVKDDMVLLKNNLQAYLNLAKFQ